MVVKKVVIDKANRLYQLAPDILSFSREKTRPKLLKKVDLLDLARFNWPVGADADHITADSWLKPATATELTQLRETLAEWFLANQRVKLNPNREIFVGGPISSIMLSVGMAFVDYGDIVFVPELGIPLYKKVTTASCGQPVAYTVSPKSNWQPDFERVNSQLGRVARLLFVNSPHNPTGAVLGEKEWADLIWMAARENIVIVNDAAYYSVGDRPPVSMMAVKDARKVGIEVYSFSYAFGLPALPFGFAVGHADVISGLAAASSVTRATVPRAYVELALAAIRQYPSQSLQQLRKTLDQAMVEAAPFLELLSLEKAGYDTIPFLWAKIERRRQAVAQASLLYRRGRILVSPGTGFGENGEGFLRLSLTASPEAYRSACERVKGKLRLVKLGDES